MSQARMEFEPTFEERVIEEGRRLRLPLIYHPAGVEQCPQPHWSSYAADARVVVDDLEAAVLIADGFPWWVDTGASE